MNRPKSVSNKDEIFLAAALLPWYDRHARDLPWRGTKDPYRIWVSEIMLQQTRAETVIPYYERFLRRLPNVRALAEVPEEELLKLWEGLGYYSRARNLQKAAKVVCERHGGEFPRNPEDIAALPGIGPYTAGAVASIAFDAPTPAVDGNVMRVAARVFGIEEDIARAGTRKIIADIVRAEMPETRRGDFTQALMELGAAVCVPNGAPRCALCPLAARCRARAEGQPERYPVKAPAKARKIEHFVCLLICRDGKIALERRGQTGVLAGMYQFPLLPGPAETAEIEARLRERGTAARVAEPGPASKHVFSHLEWHMQSVLANADAPGDFLWVTPRELRDEIPLPAAFRPFREFVLTRFESEARNERNPKNQSLVR